MYLSCIFFFLFPAQVSLCPPRAEASEKDIKVTVSNFFYYINNGKYEKAYNSFSDAIKQEVPYGKFEEKARDIKKAKIVRLSVYDQDRYLAKLHIKAKLYIVYRNRCFEALYGGTCDVQYVNRKWKLLAIDLKALEQKEVLKDPIHFGR